MDQDEIEFMDDSLFLWEMAINITRDTNNTKIIDCLNEELIWSKLLLFKLPLEALDKCQNSSCYNDQKIEFNLIIEEILMQTKICLRNAEMNTESNNKFMEFINKCDFHIKHCLENFIKKMESKPDVVHPLLSKILSIFKQIDDGKNVLELMDDADNGEIVDLAKEILRE